jgi:hypothetical protein
MSEGARDALTSRSLHLSNIICGTGGGRQARMYMFVSVQLRVHVEGGGYDVG